MSENNNNNTAESLFSQSFFCPLTLQVMKDPVIDHEGNSYEKEAIENWLSKNSTSPVTRSPLHLNNLAPNRALKEAIEERRKELAQQGITITSEKLEKAHVQIHASNKSPSTEEVSLEVVSTSIDTNEDTEATILVNVQTPSSQKPTPSDIVCVVDISGSMATEATVQNNQGVSESHGLSLLDVVKHAVKTIINILQPSDRLAIVVYSDNARVELNLTTMDKKGKDLATKKIEGVFTEGSTNLWDGLFAGMEVIRKSKSEGRLSSVLLLTDGQPNVIPPRGHLPMLKKYKDDYPDLSLTINTFGFGYNLDSALLQDLAVEGNGMYAFIPDSGFVGTIFVNATSALLSTLAGNVNLSIEPLVKGSTVSKIFGGFPSQHSSWGELINLSSLQYDQAKSVVFTVKIPKGSATDKPIVRATLKYTNQNGIVKESVAESSIAEKRPSELEVQQLRLISIDALRAAHADMKGGNQANATNSIKTVIETIKQSSSKDDPRIQGLLKDLEGQVLEALTKRDYFTKWGVHYLPSLVNAHLLQICNNFKDPGVQFYGGKLFRDLRDRADEIFVKLPPPKPSANPKAKPVNMATYYNYGGGCFHGDCMVKMADGTFKAVKNISQGDNVMTSERKSTKVVCVLKHQCKGGVIKLVEFQAGGLLITPYHPVRIQDKWYFPNDLGEAKEYSCDLVFNFVLQEDHIMQVNGVDCVTLGHSFQEDVVKHAYFGTQRIIDDLKQTRGWKSGFVYLPLDYLVRDPITNLVIGMSQEISQQ